MATKGALWHRALSVLRRSPTDGSPVVRFGSFGRSTSIYTFFSISLLLVTWDFHCPYYMDYHDGKTQFKYLSVVNKKFAHS